MSPDTSEATRDLPAWPPRLQALGAWHRLGGNQPIRLDDPARAWRVVEGEVELFLVNLDEQGQEGSRHHLASVPEGGLLLGLPGQVQADFVLLAVPHADSLLQALEVSLLEAESTADDMRPALAASLETWLRALSAGMARWAWPRPAIGLGLSVGESLRVPAQRRCAGQRDLAWISLAPDAAVFLDIQDLPADASELVFPLAPEAWMLATRDIELQARSTEDALREGDAWAGVQALHRILFETADMNLRLANVDEFNRLQARRARTEADRDLAFTALMSVTDPRPRALALAQAAQGDTPLVSALRMIGRREGFEIRLPAQADGEQVPELDRIALASSLRMRDIRLRDGWWREDFGCLLAFDKVSEQPVVLRCDGQGRALLIDPVRGDTWDLRRDEAARARLAPMAHEFSAPLPLRTIGFRELWAFAWARGWRDLVPMLLAGAVGGLIGIVTPVATAYLIDSVIPNHERGHLLELGLAMLVLGGAAFVASTIASLAFARAESRMGRAVQSGMMDRVLRLPMGFFQQFSAGDLANRLMSITQIQDRVSSSSVQALLAGLFGVFSFALMFFYDARLAWWATLLTAVYLLLSVLISHRRLVLERPLAQLGGELNNTLLQLILGVAKIRLAAAEDRAFARWARLFAQARRLQLRSQRLSAWQTALNGSLTLAGLLLFVALIGRSDQSPSLMAVGAFAALWVAFQRFAAGLSTMIQAGTELLGIEPLLARARPLLDAVPEVSREKADPGPISGAIEVSHLKFRYLADGPLVLDDISLDVAPGEFVALVGASGSGKSTLLRLLLGFETPEAGGILFDGRNLSGLDAPAVRRQMGVVMQNAQLLPRSLFDNIAGISGCTLEEAWEAAEQVGLADDIRKMPMGMQTLILEGGGALSGGQMQRLMIARAIVGRPKILLLDEATSALDNRTQAVVTDSLDRLRVTRLVVAHRLSTIVHADRIHVMEGGRIVESGTYDALMAAHGLFARLARRQMI